METIEVVSPTRVDLAGGTLDCWPLYNLVAPHCVTINFSLGLCSQVRLTPHAGPEIEVNLADLNCKQTFASYSEFMAFGDQRFDIIRGIIEYVRPPSGFRLDTKSESPVGAGLGGSSSLTVSILKAFGKWIGRSWATLEMVEVAHNLESKLINSPTGTQDYFPAVESGLHFIHYTADGPRLETKPIPKSLFEEHMTLVYTGVPHHSGLNNWQVIKAVIEGDRDVLKSLREIGRVSHAMMKSILQGDWLDIPQLFDEEFRWRVNLTPFFSSPRIEELKALVLSAGAQSVKICGAGGGGCVAVWSQPSKKGKVDSACLKSGFQILPLNLYKI